MKISPTKLKKAIEAAKLNPADLAATLVETGLRADDAAAALGNWMRGSDHPRCKPAYIAQLAKGLGLAPKDICVFQSRVVSHRGSPRKAKLLTDLIRGKSVDQALNLLSFTPKRAALNIKKCLAAAIADAQQAEADETSLYVCDSRVDGAQKLKRFHQKDRGRAHAILKPLSHITVSVEERRRPG